MENYFNYFTEIEEHFQRRRGGILLLSTLDWALIETWKDAGIPQEAVLRGIDAAFERYDKRPSRSRKVNSLAYCAQEVQLESAKLPSQPGISPEAVAGEIAGTLREMAAEIEGESVLPKLEDLERRLTVQEEKLFAVLLAAVVDDEIVSVRTQADRELAPYRSKMPAAQVEQLQKQYVHKKLLEEYGIPRLSLFYM